MWVLAGMLTFLTIEKFARIMQIGHSHGEDGHGHSHGTPAKKAKDSDAESESEEEKADEKKKEESTDDAVESWIPQMDVAGYLNLAADFSHNFTDGLAIGASYLAGNSVGLVRPSRFLFMRSPTKLVISQF